MSNLIDKIYPILTDPKKDPKNGKFVMSINAPWGFGKTHLANKLIEKINNPSDNNYNSAIALSIDLSDYDYVNDPLIPLIIEILNAIENLNLITSEKKNEIKRTLKTLIVTTATALSALDPTGISGNVLKTLNDTKDKFDNVRIKRIDETLETYKSYSEIIKQISQSIEKIIDISIPDPYDIEKKISRIVIFIDNFDRVESKFIFKFLNIIYKLDTPHVTFCLLMNKEQLQANIYHTIMSKPSEESEHFLEKYVDFELCLPNPLERNDCARMVIDPLLHEVIDKNDIKEIIKGISIRQLKQVNFLYQDLVYQDSQFADPQKPDLKRISFLMGCFVVIAKNELIPIWYGIGDNFHMKKGTTINNIYSEIVYFSQQNNEVNSPSILRNNDNIFIKLVFEQNIIIEHLFNNSMRIILKEI